MRQDDERPGGGGAPAKVRRGASSSSSSRRLTLAAMAAGALLYVSSVEVVWISRAFSTLKLAAGTSGVASTPEDRRGRAASSAVTPSTVRSSRSSTSSSLTTWADTRPGRACHQMLPFEIEGERLSYAVAWEELRASVLNATYYPDWLANETTFRNWVGGIFQYYTHERLRTSQAHPAPRESVRQIWRLIEKRIDDPENHPPVRIAVFGGSVTSGRDCHVNPLDLPGTSRFPGTQPWCAYPNRLDVLLNRVLFPNRPEHDRARFPVFEVINMAVQATNSEVGAMALEYNLIPRIEESPPHVVISSYAANDAGDGNEAATRKNQQAFVMAAQNLRPCDDHLPLVVMADDWYTHMGPFHKALTNTGSLYKTAAWHNIMAIMYSNVVRAGAVLHSNLTATDWHPLFGSQTRSGSHLGMGFHIGQGWTLFFNLLGALHDACAEPQPAQLLAPAAPLPSELARELPIKYMGRYRNHGPEILRDWDRATRFKERRCDNATAPAAVPVDSRPPYSTSNCAYAWVVNPMTRVSVGKGVRGAIDHALVSQVGWDVKDRKPKTGWYTNLTEFNLTRSTEARFTLEVPNVTQPVDTFTILSLKSYGPEWADSRVTVAVDVLPGPGVEGGVRRPKPPTTQASVDGSHPLEISVFYPHRFTLKGGGARVGDTIRATVTLAQGTNFMISGIAFCRSLTPESESP